MVSRLVRLSVCIVFCILFLFLSTYSISTSYCSFDSFIAGQLIYEKLPQDISDRHVLLLDPILGTGLFLHFFFLYWF